PLRPRPAPAATGWGSAMRSGSRRRWRTATRRRGATATWPRKLRERATPGRSWTKAWASAPACRCCTPLPRARSARAPPCGRARSGFGPCGHANECPSASSSRRRFIPVEGAMAALSRVVATVYEEPDVPGFRRRSVGAGHALRVDRCVVLVLGEVAERQRGLLERRALVVGPLRDLGRPVVPDRRAERRHEHQRV